MQLQKRADLIPNILKIAQKFMEHETALFQDITKLRTQALNQYDKNNPEEVKGHLQNAASLSSQMGRFMMNVENYPDLKSNQNMLQAQETYNEVEGQIAAARRFYNSAVEALNTSTQIFPGSLIASMANCKEMPFYKADEEAKEPVDASDYLK